MNKLRTLLGFSIGTLLVLWAIRPQLIGGTDAESKAGIGPGKGPATGGGSQHEPLYSDDNASRPRGISEFAEELPVKSTDSSDNDGFNARRSWMASSLWLERNAWNDYPGYLATAETYANDPEFNPKGIALSEEQLSELEAEIVVWREEIDKQKYKEHSSIHALLRNPDSSTRRLFRPDSEELALFQEQHDYRNYYIAQAATTTKHVDPELLEDGSVFVVVMPGENPDLEAAKRNLWDLAVGANDSIASYFSRLERID